MRRLILFFVFLIPFSLFSIEISLEENKAESGTVGYVDIVKIFNRFAVDYKKGFDKAVGEKQKIVDDRKVELNFFKAQKEKLNFEYQIAKMYEDYNKALAAVLAQSSDVSTNTTVSNSTDTVLESVKSSSETVSVSTEQKNIEAPYIIMPGVGKITLSNYKFSFSSSTVEIEKEISNLDKKISDIEKNLSELKSKFDDELSKKAAKDNEYVLKKIYNAIEEVARSEGVSVVVDKKNILFGRKTVDLTDKVIKKLEE